MAAPSASARCGQHPDAAAVSLCARCGAFLCGACTEVLEETAYCEPCAERRLVASRPSLAVRGLLVANALGLVLLGSPVAGLSWSTRPGALSGGEVVALALGWTLVSAVAGTVVSTRRLARRDEMANPAAEYGLRILSGLNLVGVALWGAFAAFVLSLLRPGA
jgi:DNA-directed RNA polymerase subunit RPC12/RpoP